MSSPIKITLLSDLAAMLGPDATGPVKVAGVSIQVVVDETLPPGMFEMRSPGHPPVRVVNIAPDVATCRYCAEPVVHGKHGWRLDVNDSSGYECGPAPLGYHGVNKTAGRPDPQVERE